MVLEWERKRRKKKEEEEGRQSERGEGQVVRAIPGDEVDREARNREEKRETEKREKKGKRS